MIDLGIREYLIGESITWLFVEIPDWIPKILAGYTYGCSQHEKSTGCLVKTILVRSKKLAFLVHLVIEQKCLAEKKHFEALLAVTYSVTHSL